MAIKLGTIAPIGFDGFPPADWLACLRRLGCAVVQAYRNQKADVSVSRMQDYIAAGQLPCDSLHGLYGEEYDPSACEESHRRFAVDTFKKEGEVVLQLGGALVVVHSSTIREQGVEEAERRRRVDQLKRTIDELGRHGEQMGVTYAFENLPRYHAIGWDIGELSGILDEAGGPGTGMCFDTGHALMTGDPATQIRAADGRIAYVHLNDNSGQADEHEMPSYGVLDCDAMADALREVGYAGTVMLEVFHSIDRLNELIADGCADRLARLVARASGDEGAS